MSEIQGNRTMVAIFRNVDGSEFQREVEKPPPPKAAIDGRYYRLSKGLSGSDGRVIVVYDEVVDAD